MAAILRVKRKKDDEPLDALLISCKRQKVEREEDTVLAPLTAIVKFAGTVEKQDDCVLEHITKTLSKDDLKTNYKQHIVDITKKTRERKKQESNENRYKIINSIRSLDTSLLEDLEEDVVNIIDIEDTKAAASDKSDYVYDLYYTQTKETIQIENLLSVIPVEEDLVFEDYFKDNENQNEESEDSNSESNWRNDYPDSDHSENSIGENDIRNAMKKLNVDDDSSSDDNEFVYGLDEDDVERYGWKYAFYKARMKKEIEGDNESNGDDHSNMDEYASSDSSSDCNLNYVDDDDDE